MTEPKLLDTRGNWKVWHNQERDEFYLSYPDDKGEDRIRFTSKTTDDYSKWQLQHLASFLEYQETPLVTMIGD